MRDLARGQILPLFAIVLVVLCGFAALAIDVSNVYSARRAYRSAADAAALAGAQNLFMPGTRALDVRTYSNARTSAFDSVKQRLGQPGFTWTGCSEVTPALRRCDLKDTGGTVVYRVAVKAPIGSGCLDCDPIRAVGVEITRPAYPLAFARVLGFNSFRIGVASVAGLRVKKAYTIVTLRPPSSGQNGENSAISYGGSGTYVKVREGDVASNGNMAYNGGTEQLQLDSSYEFDYYDPYSVGRRWETPSGILPEGTRLTTPILEPDYSIPTRPSSGWGPQPIVTAGTNTPCRNEAEYLRDTTNYGPYFVDVPDANITCWQPGTYADASVSGKQLAILSPGLYFFPSGLDVKGGVIGGYRANDDGVALVFGRTGEFKNSTDTSFAGDIVALNAGSRSLDSVGGTGQEALPARYPNDNAFGPRLKNTPIKTEDGKALTVMVQGDGSCTVLAHSSCSPSNVLRLTGGARIYLAGVQFAPEDNATISGNSGGIGIIGQLWSWTLTYVGNSTIYQGGADKAKPGVIRLDVACTSTMAPCPAF